LSRVLDSDSTLLWEGDEEGLCVKRGSTRNVFLQTFRILHCACLHLEARNSSYYIG